MLPRMPVPNLDKTLDRYLAGLKAVLNDEQFEKTRQLVEQFRVHPGPSIQAQLEAFAEKVDNWATYFWLDDMYLKNPAPLPVNSSANAVTLIKPFPSNDHRLRCCAQLIRFAIYFKIRHDNNKLAPDVFPTKYGDIPLCMATYKNFFPSYRRPGQEKDELVFSEAQGPNHPWHIIVACNNQFFKVQVKSSEPNGIPSEETVLHQLQQVMEMAAQNEDPVLAGLLTTEDRRIWAKMRQHMIKNEVNARSLAIIEDCLFVVFLEDWPLDTPLNNTAAGNYMLHGNGTRVAAANRWYDKSWQVGLMTSGIHAVVLEHSTSDGVTMFRFLEEFVDFKKDAEAASARPSAICSSWPAPVPLQWKVDDVLSAAIQEAAAKMDKVCENVDFVHHCFTKYGKAFVKSLHLKVDSYIQAALQLTYYRMYGRLVSTYESGSLRKFHHGRIDNIRACTEEALHWVKTMCDPQETDERKVKLFKRYMEKLSDIMNYTLNGEGPDNHLLALRELAKSSNYPDIPLFQDDSYKEYLNFRLTTSQMPNKEHTVSSYGPVVPDGYGCCYSPFLDCIDFSVCSFVSCKDTDSKRFVQHLEESLLHMARMLKDNASKG